MGELSGLHNDIVEAGRQHLDSTLSDVRRMVEQVGPANTGVILDIIADRK